MASRTQKIAAAAVIGGCLLALPSIIKGFRWAREDYKAFVKERDLETRTRWLATGVVVERARSGYYNENYPGDRLAQTRAADEDYEFEKIRIRYDNPPV